MKSTKTSRSKGIFGTIIAFFLGVISFIFLSSSKSSKKVKNIEKDISTSEEKIEELDNIEEERIKTINNNNIDTDDALDYLEDFVNRNKRL